MYPPTSPFSPGKHSIALTLFRLSYTPTRDPSFLLVKTNIISRLSAEEMGGPAAGVYFIPHSQYAAQMMFNLGIGIDKYFPLDHGHTAPYLASLMAQEFVLGLKCGSAPLQGMVVNATSRIESSLLGTCLPVNATLPI
jgi:rhamnogalacturonan acetylesterase